MYQIKSNGKNILELGRQGENLARQVVFDLSAWEAEYGPGVAELIHQRPGDAAPYPVAAVREGGTLVWTLTSADTAVASSYGSDGHCELRYYVGDTLAKSKTWRTWVEPAMDTPSETEPPEPQQGWVDQVLSTGIAAEKAAADAKADADRAAKLVEEVSAKADQAAQDATVCTQAKEAAQTAQRLAETAQQAADTAKQAAVAAQEAVAKSATDAEAAKQSAETAMRSAQEAAESAAQALADIQALYQQVQALAQGSIQAINEAGSAAVQLVQSAGDSQVQRVTAEGAAQTANAKSQADAAAQSAAGAAQSAQEAAESASVYDNVVADVTQLKQDILTKVPKTDYAPEVKTEDMTQPVGKDESGKLWTISGGEKWEEIANITLSEEATALEFDLSDSPLKVFRVELYAPSGENPGYLKIFTNIDTYLGKSYAIMQSNGTFGNSSSDFPRIFAGEVFCFNGHIYSNVQQGKINNTLSFNVSFNAPQFSGGLPARSIKIAYSSAAVKFPVGTMVTIEGVRA